MILKRQQSKYIFRWKKEFVISVLSLMQILKFCLIGQIKMIWDGKIVRHEGIKSNDKGKCASIYKYPYTGQQ